MTNFTEVPAPDGFELRITRLDGCRDPECSGCTTTGGTLFLHWLSPVGDDAWLLIASTYAMPARGTFSPEAGDEFLRYCLTLGVCWDDMADPKVIAAKQAQLMNAMPEPVRDHMRTASIDDLRANRAEAYALANQVADGLLTDEEVTQLLSVDTERPL